MGRISARLDDLEQPEGAVDLGGEALRKTSALCERQAARAPVRSALAAATLRWFLLRKVRAA